MNKEEFIVWLQARVSRQVKLTISACAGLALAGVASFLMTGGLLFLLMWYLYNSTAVPFMMVSTLYSVTAVYVLFTVRQHLPEQHHEAEWNGELVEFQLATPLAHFWNYSMGSLDSDRSIPERILNFFVMSPRFFWSAWQAAMRVTELNEVNCEA